MLPSEIGERAEAAILAALVADGKEILVPFGQRRYDLAYEEDGRLVKVQCKAGCLSKDRTVLNFRTHSVGRKSVRGYQGEVDYFGVYCHERREVYLVPIDGLPASRATLRLAPARNGQTSRTRPASDFVLGRTMRARHLSNAQTPPLPGIH